MNIQKIILKLIIILVTFNSCSKDEEIDIAESAPEYPMKSLLENGAMELKSTKINSAFNFEAGYKFKSFKNGKITALGVRVPNNETYRVTLWNADSEEIIETIDVNSTSGLLSFEDIDPIDIVSGTEYFVSVNTNDYYMFDDGGNQVFPIENDNILILGYSSKLGTSQFLPTQLVKVAYLGMVDVKFISNN